MDTTTAILKALCLITITANLVSGAQIVDYKRHYATQANGDRATRSPRVDEPLCRNVCLNVNRECSASCYKPQGTAHTTFTTTWNRGGTLFNVNKDDSRKYECIDHCLKQDEDPYLIPNGCDSDASIEEEEEAEENTERPSAKEGEEEENPIELATLTTKRRCQLPAYRNSTVCKFEDDDPEIAKKVFDANKPKLTVCMGGGGPVMSGRRGLYTYHAMKSFLSRQDQLRLNTEFESSFPNQERRSIQDDEEEDDDEDIPTTQTPRRKKRTRRNLDDVEDVLEREKRQTPLTIIKRGTVRRPNMKGGKELCITEKKLESPSKAIHIATEAVVDLYFYGGYSQWFEVGGCKHQNPITSVSVKDALNIRCDMAMTAHRAYIIIEPAKMRDSHKVKGCSTIPAMDKKYHICRDWVYLPSHCKLFYS